MSVVDEPFKILSIDGGGIRGIYPARFLAELEDSLLDSPGDRLHNYFDLICGTSTGGIIALGLALGMSAQEVLNLYRENAQKIFPGKPRMISYFRRAKYSSSYLSNLLKSAFEPFSKNGETRLGHAKTRLCIPAFNIGLGKAQVYKTPHHEELIRDYQIPAHDVALSTAAAPIYFKPHSFDYKHVGKSNSISVLNNVDGAVIANNPTLLGIIEAHCALKIPLQHVKVLSLGTGHMTFSEPSPRRQFGAFYWLNQQRVFEMMFSAQAQNVDNTIKFLNRGLGQGETENFFYKRVQHEFQQGQAIAMDENNKSKLLQLEDIGVQSFKEHGAEVAKEFLSSTKRQYKPLKHL